MEIDVFTLFPEAFAWFERQRHVANALAARPPARVRQLPRPHAAERRAGRRHPVRRRRGHGAAGRRGRGGAAGALRPRSGRAAPRAARDRADARRDGCSTTRSSTSWRARTALTLLSGRYEGFDQRIVEHFASDEVSIGRYVLAGGELAAMVVCDAVLRKLPGALGHPDSALEESFSDALAGAPRVSALHAPGRVPRLARPRRAPVRPPRPDQGVAPRAERGAGSRLHRRSATIGAPAQAHLRCELGPTDEHHRVWQGSAPS